MRYGLDLLIRIIAVGLCLLVILFTARTLESARLSSAELAEASRGGVGGVPGQVTGPLGRSTS